MTNDAKTIINIVNPRHVYIETSESGVKIEIPDEIAPVPDVSEDDSDASDNESDVSDTSEYIPTDTESESSCDGVIDDASDESDDDSVSSESSESDDSVNSDPEEASDENFVSVNAVDAYKGSEKPVEKHTLFCVTFLYRNREVKFPTNAVTEKFIVQSDVIQDIDFPGYVHILNLPVDMFGVLLESRELEKILGFNGVGDLIDRISDGTEDGFPAFESLQGSEIPPISRVISCVITV